MRDLGAAKRTKKGEKGQTSTYEGGKENCAIKTNEFGALRLATIH